MIFIQPQPEPPDFNERVRIPGNEWLISNPDSSPKQFPRYWKYCINDLAQSYRSVCAYSAHWFPALGSESVDHYIPKSHDRSSVYEWSNYRYCTSRMNFKKGNSLSVIDPFHIEGDWFELVFPALLIRSCSNLRVDIQNSVEETIKILELNSEILIKTRLEYILEYCDGDMTLNALMNRAPFIAYELQRQGLTERVIDIFQRRRL